MKGISLASQNTISPTKNLARLICVLINLQFVSWRKSDRFLLKLLSKLILLKFKLIFFHKILVIIVPFSKSFNQKDVVFLTTDIYSIIQIS